MATSFTDFWLGKDVGAKDRAAQDRIWGPLRLQTQSLYNTAYGKKLAGIGAVKRGGAAAGRIVDTTGSSIRRRITADAGSEAASDRASLAERGLGHSIASVDSGSHADMAAAREAVQAGIAALRSGVDMSRTMALADEYNSMAELQQIGMRQQLQMDVDRAQAYAAIRRGRVGGALKPVLSAVGAIVGGIYGGFGGASAGAGLGNAVGGAAQGG